MNAGAGRVVVDPVTRIDGQLRIEAVTDADGRVTQACRSAAVAARSAVGCMPLSCRS